MSAGKIEQSTIKEHLSNTQSTHGLAAQASAARALLLLRKTYADIQTHILGQEHASPVDQNREIDTQKCLISYLEQLIHGNELPALAESPHLSSIKSTIETINHIQQRKNDNAAHTQQVFQKMLVLAKTCPGLNWTANNQIHSCNFFYNTETKKQETVLASPAETLNLVCRALIDENRYAQADEFLQRIDSLYQNLLKSSQEEAAGNFEFCAAGRQHDLVFLLNQIYLDKPLKQGGKPLLLIESLGTFILKVLTFYIEQQMQAVTATERLQLVVDCLRWQDEASEEPSPLLTFLQVKDQDWMQSCHTLLKSECELMGLDPNNLSIQRKMEEFISQVSDLSLPECQDNLIPVLQQIFSVKPLTPPEKNLAGAGAAAGAIDSLEPLITSSMQALKTFKMILTVKDCQAPVIKDFAQALDCLALLLKHKQYSIFLSQGLELMCAKEVLFTLLVQYFTDYHLGKRLPEDFNQAHADYLTQKKAYAESVSIDFFTHFFALVKEHSWDYCFSRLSALNLTLNDDDLSRWQQENTFIQPDGQMIKEIIPWQINRILLHAVVTPPQQWSEKFQEVLMGLTQFLSRPAKEQDSMLLSAFKKSYPQHFLDNLIFILFILQTPLDIPNIKEQCQPYLQECLTRGKSIAPKIILDHDAAALNPLFDALQAKLNDSILKKYILAMVNDAQIFHLLMSRLYSAVSYQAAIALYERAIALGDNTAMNNRASMHTNGQGGPVDYDAANALFARAIALGNTAAMNNRAYMYLHGQGGPMDYAAAIALFEQAIVLGDASAMHNRARMHEEGEGGPIDYPAAIALYERAIGLSHSYAMFSRANMYLHGRGGPVDYAAAIRLYNSSILLGNILAINNRASMYLFGQGGPVDYAAASALFERAIALGNSSAMNNRASMYQRGQGTPVDYAAAIVLFDRAIALGNHSSMSSRASMYRLGQGGPVNYPAAIVLYDRAIALGNTQAIINRGWMYLKGEGGPVDYLAAIALFNRAIALGDSDAMVNRASMYQGGEGGPVDYPAAIALLEQAIGLNNMGAMTNRATMHRGGEGGPVNYPEAIALYEHAMDLGSADAMNNRAFMHKNGEGGPVDYPAAAALFNRAIDLGNPNAMNNRAWMYQHGQGGPIDYPAAIALYEHAMALNFAPAMNNRALMHTQGEGGPVDYAAAIPLFEQAIDLGNSNAMFNRASMHHNGQGGPIDYPKAILLYERAIALGHDTAMSNRALMHTKGQGGPVNYPAAIALYEQAVVLGNTTAIYNLASMYEHGGGGPIDYPAAIALYQRGIALGDASSMNNRALMHHKGLGGPVDYPAAIALYGQAIALGHANAMYNRAWMYAEGKGGPVDYAAAIDLLHKALPHCNADFKTTCELQISEWMPKIKASASGAGFFSSHGESKVPGGIQSEKDSHCIIC